MKSAVQPSVYFFISHARDIFVVGAVLNGMWNQERKAAGFFEPDDTDTDRGTRVAIEAVRLLIKEGK